MGFFGQSAVILPGSPDHDRYWIDRERNLEAWRRECAQKEAARLNMVEITILAMMERPAIQAKLREILSAPSAPSAQAQPADAAASE